MTQTNLPATELPGGLRIWPVPAFRDNYIWVLETAGRAVVVDPGDAAPVQEALRSRGWLLEAILVTHHHADHVGGVAALAGSAPVIAPQGSPFQGATRTVQDGQAVEVLGARFEVMAVPGHTLDHIAYACTALGVVFCGDTLFACGCGRLFEGTPAQMAASLARLAALPAHTLVFCAHEYTSSNIRFARAVEPGNGALAQRELDCAAQRQVGLPTVPSTVGLELATNPFLRCQAPEVLEAVQRHAGRRPAGPVEAFAALRAWKDTF